MLKKFTSPIPPAILPKAIPANVAEILAVPDLNCDEATVNVPSAHSVASVMIRTP
jgi:hypothetical protein